jgi:hypothetical protein
VYESGKMRHVETTAGMGRCSKENDGGEEFNCDRL